MRAVGALLAADLEQTTLLEPFKHFVQQQMFCLPSHQTCAELRQYTEVEAWIRQLEPERVFPVNAGAHGIGGLAVTQMLQKLENSHQGQSPWSKA